ncbi:ARM repeat-containing protein [Anaeromyces robustus]|uniref:ARM repeat-containing protein n=1 Tax=Anaeromyces robustus TaxID=1754192 RepID=A0A1Y1WZS5_9FUNG|nr:ARM repeat-containing protein [Anaeromyces robustus]|eukprot:ORX79079.1 ARM repeat-containing protein [Anaeromyces robustus]
MNDNPINTNIPSVEEVENVIKQFYECNQAEIRKPAEHWLHELQKQPYAWRLPSQLLNSNQISSQFFGAHTFQVKILRDWNTLHPDEIIPLKNELISWIKKYSSSTQIVLTKLCLALTSFALQASPEIWPNFISSFIDDINMEEQRPDLDDNTKLNLELAKLEFLTVVPEQVTTAQLLANRKGKINEELSTGFLLVLNILNQILSIKEKNESIIKLQQKSLKCLQSWVQYDAPISTLGMIIESTINALLEVENFQPAAEVLIEILTHPSSRKFEKTLCDNILKAITTGWIYEEFNKTIENEDEESARVICKLMTTLGEEFTEYIVINFLRPDVITYLKMMMSCTAFPGYPAIDQDITDTTYNFWFNLTEIIEDPYVIPLPKMDNKENDDILIYRSQPLSSSNPQMTPEQGLQIRNASLEVFRQLIEIIRQKMQYPTDEEKRSWKRENFESFNASRREASDTVISAYYIVKDQSLDYLVNLCKEELIKIYSGNANWQVLESSLQCLKAISEAIDMKENIYISKLFSDEIFKSICNLPKDNFDRVKITMLNLIASYAEWLKNHEAFIPNIMDFIITSISQPSLLLPASKAFLEVCNHCKKSLVNIIDVLVNIYMQLPDSIQRERSRIVQALAEVFQTLPNERSIPIMLALQNNLQEKIKETLIKINNTGDQDKFKELINIQLNHMVSFSKGIIPPDENSFADLAERVEYESNVNKENKIELTQEQFHQFEILSNGCYEIIEMILRLYSNDYEIMSVVSQFFKFSFRSVLPLLSPKMEILTLLISTCYECSKQSNILVIIKDLLWVYSPYNEYPCSLLEINNDPIKIDRNIVLLLTSVTQTTIQYLDSEIAVSQNRDTVHFFFSMLVEFINIKPNLFKNLQPELLEKIFGLLLIALKVQDDKFALQQVKSFLTGFILCDNENSELKDISHQVMLIIGNNVIKEILYGIGGGKPRSLINILADILFRMKNKYSNNVNEWLNSLLAQDGFPSKHVDNGVKQRFIKDVMSTRQFTKFKTIISEFSIRCRNLQGTSFGSAF